MVILNSYMDLCVRYSMADKAIDLFNEVNRNQKLENQSSKTLQIDEMEYPLECLEISTSQIDSEKHDHNMSIQMGILIKAYG